MAFAVRDRRRSRGRFNAARAGSSAFRTRCGRHIACEIGIAAIARLVADALDATLVQQN